MRLTDLEEAKSITVSSTVPNQGDLKVYDVGIAADLVQLVNQWDDKRGTYTELRGLVDARHCYVWRAAEEIHHFAANRLGVNKDDFDHVYICREGEKGSAGEWYHYEPYRDIAGLRIYFKRERHRLGLLQRNRMMQRLLNLDEQPGT